MRRTLRLLANVKPARYLEAGNPTGLTGLPTHASPRSSLLYLYGSTLDKIKAAPESSMYRQSVEALTRHRLAIVAASEPPGWAEWQTGIQKVLDENPDGFRVADEAAVDGVDAQLVERDGSMYMIRSVPEWKDERLQEWDGDKDTDGEVEMLKSGEQRAKQFDHFFARVATRMNDKPVTLEPEPQLTADQVAELENKIGAGLIEEVVEVAESELHLVDIMLQAKPWESLEEKPVEGQWKYFERNSA